MIFIQIVVQYVLDMELICPCLDDFYAVMVKEARNKESTMKRTTIFLGDADRTAIQTIKDRFGISSDSDAIRLALRVIAGVPNNQLLLLPSTNGTAAEEQEHVAYGA